jgi:serine/threonine-protein kinase
MNSVETDRNLLFGVLAIQGELIDSSQFAEACTAWSVRKDRPLADILVERGWISSEDRQLIEQLLERKLKKHCGDAHKSLIAAAASAAGIQATLGSLQAGAADNEIRQTLSSFAHSRVASGTIEYLSALGHRSESRDRYTLTSLHAKGGIGQVWLARDMGLDREVALKELRPERSGDHAVLRRFLQEARITGQLDHPGVVPVYELAQGEAGSKGGQPYYTMRFIRGRTLSEAIAAYHRKQQLAQARPTELLALIQAFVGVCNTVAFAHSRGVIHRDLKGQNIVLGEFGEVVLLDWGLAKLLDDPGEPETPDDSFDPAVTAPYLGEDSGSALTAAGQVMGTPAYMAPEQAEGRSDRIGRATDVYGLGAILYEILAGRPPFEGDSMPEVLRRVREEPPVPPSRLNRAAPRALESISNKAMAKDPGARYASASELAADVQHWLADEPVSAWQEPWSIRTRRWVNRHRTQVAAAGAALVVAIIGLAVTLAIQTRAKNSLEAALERESIALDETREQTRQAERAIDLYITNVSEDVILRRPELQQLRSRLLGSALNFHQSRLAYMKSTEARGYDYRYSARTGLERIASLQASIGDRQSAIETRRQVVALNEQDPSRSVTHAAQALLELGNLQRQAGRPEDALRSLRDARDRYKRLNTDSAGAPLINLALAESDIGRLLSDTGKNEEALVGLERARDIQEELIKGLRGSMEDFGGVPKDLAATYTILGNIHDSVGKYEEALRDYEKAWAIRSKLREHVKTIRPKDDFSKSEWARALNNLGLAKAKIGKLEEGRRDVEQGMQARQELYNDQPLNIGYQSDLARSAYHLAQIQILAHELVPAVTSMEKAEELYKGIPPKEPEDLYFQACMKSTRAGLVGNGQDEKTLSPADQSDRKRLADEALAVLRQAASQGYSNATRFRLDPALAPLRSRPEFEELLRSLERPSP